MCKTKLFYHILDVVTSETELDCHALLSKNKSREIVDARYILIYFLYNIAGFDITYISERIQMTPQGVRQIARTFKIRRKQSGKIFEITLQRIKNDPEINALLAE